MPRDFKHIGKDLKHNAKVVRSIIKGDLQRIIGVEGLRHFDKSSEKEGWVDKNFNKWKPRKEPEKKFKKKGGQRKDYKHWKAKNKGRRILMSHRTDTKGGHMRHSISYRIVGTKVIFYTDKAYAQVHNEGGKAGRGIGFVMKKRQFMGASHTLDMNIKKKLDKRLDKILK